MDLRAGAPAAERGTRSRSLRGPLLAGPSPPRAHDDDRLCFPPASPPRSRKAEKKESTGPRLSRLCPPCATPSSSSSLDHRRSDARIAENGSATNSGVNKSAKVVLAPPQRRHHVLGEPAQLLLEFLGRQAFGPVDHEIVEPGIFRRDRLDAVDHLR